MNKQILQHFKNKPVKFYEKLLSKLYRTPHVDVTLNDHVIRMLRGEHLGYITFIKPVVTQYIKDRLDCSTNKKETIKQILKIIQDLENEQNAPSDW